MLKAAKYMGVADAVAALSKDDRIKVGAVLVGPDGDGGPWGYNGAPRGSSKDDYQHTLTHQEKKYAFEHAERNAIYNAARQGVAIKGWTLVVTHPPCAECARAIIQAGIETVIYRKPASDPAKCLSDSWAESVLAARELFAECGVLVREVE